MSLDNVEFVFFDVGNVFVSDDPAAAFLYRKLYEYLGGAERWTPAEFFAERLRHVAKGGNLWTFVRTLVPEADFAGWRQRTRSELFSQWEHYSPAIPGMHEVVKDLAAHYRMGLIANQPSKIREVLSKYGLWDFFQVHAISEELGIEKPDLRIFQWAIEKAGVEPSHALMVGDRVDNDIAPARRLGMKALWFSLSFEQRGWQPTDEFEQAYAESVKRHCVTTRPPADSWEQPDFLARSPEQLLSILLPETDSVSAKG
ncbi:MAG: HAD family hydrolase [Candidatus Sumerlaeaceae bacterium]